MADGNSGADLCGRGFFLLLSGAVVWLGDPVSAELWADETVSRVPAAFSAVFTGVLRRLGDRRGRADRDRRSDSETAGAGTG